MDTSVSAKGMIVKGHRSFRHFFLSIFRFDFYFLGLALMVWSLRNEALSEPGYFVMILIVAILVFAAIYTVFRYYKNGPIISIDEESITLANSIYYWKDLEKIEMTGKRPFKFMGEQKEGLLLKFKGQTERYIFDDLYENISSIKLFIEDIAIKKASDKTIPSKTVEQPRFEIRSPIIVANSANGEEGASGIDEKAMKETIFYKGFPLFSLEGIFFWSITAFFCTIVIASFSVRPQASSLIIFMIPWLLVFILLGRRVHYFGLSSGALIIKNYNLPWKKNEYSLTDIRELVFEQRHKRPVTLRVICKDFSSKTYPAATLWSKTWMQLKDDFEKKGIKVRNECVFYEPFEFKLFNDD